MSEQVTTNGHVFIFLSADRLLVVEARPLSVAFRLDGYIVADSRNLFRVSCMWLSQGETCREVLDLITNRRKRHQKKQAYAPPQA
jgi:hypothetical protein